MFDLSDAPLRADRRAADLLQPLFAGNGILSRVHLNAAMTAAYGGTDADGHWTQRDSFEVLELATSLFLRGRPYPMIALDDARHASALLARLPTQTVRGEEQVDWQQFSTPIDLAAVAVVLAAIGPEDVVLEPSAGNGLLVAHVPACAALQLNEIDPERRARLASAFPDAHISGYDGAMLGSRDGALRRPSVVLMNPPFSRSLGRGADPFAAVRHIESALRRLLPGGRLVAVLPDWFAPSARLRDVFEAVLSGISVRTFARLERAYTKHGTGVAVRLLVADKVIGGQRPALIQRKSVAELSAAITVMERCALVAPAPSRATSAGRSVGLLRAVRQAPVKPKAFFAPTRNDVSPVAYTTLAIPAPQLEQVGVYLPYRPSRLVFEAAGEHPTALVESVAMGSIPAPVPAYVPHLPERTVTERMLSTSQLEAVVYAGHAWSQTLPGRFRPAAEGVGLELVSDGRAYRQGFMLGDGTGAGKGRQVAACVLDNWLQGRRRHIWVTKSEPLLEDARRDWTALGGLSADIQPLSTWKIDESISLDRGVIFVTYPTLRSARGDRTRLQQLIDWAGTDFDGVLAFDEAHEMGGVAGGEGALGAKKGSLQGICGVLLQNHLPDARVLYASATGFEN